MAESKLTDLIAKLEAATEGSRELDLDIAQSLREPWGYTGGETPRDIKCAPITTSLDAIVALIERKLPGWGGMVSFGALTCGATLHTADLWGPVTETGETEDGIAIQLRPEEHGENRKPALALCVALLSALQLQGGSER